MKILVTGVSGYIGGSVARRLTERGHNVVGLVRDAKHSDKLKALGIEPLLGSLGDQELLQKTATQVDGVVNAASSDDAFFVTTMISALKGSGKFYLQTSGSSIVADRAFGELADKIYDEDTQYEPVLEKAGRVAIDNYVLAAAKDKVKSIVICPCLIYGQGTGIKRESVQIPYLIAAAKKSSVGRHAGKGLNIWSNVHIEDLTELYALAIEKAQAGTFFFAESGEASMKAAAEAISRMLGFGGKTEPLTLAEASALWGPASAYFTFGSNSRIRADRARKILGWNPKGVALLDDIEHGSYKQAEAQSLVKA